MYICVSFGTNADYLAHPHKDKRMGEVAAKRTRKGVSTGSRMIKIFVIFNKTTNYGTK